MKWVTPVLCEAAFAQPQLVGQPLGAVRAGASGNLLRRQVDRHGDLYVVQRIGSVEHIAEDIRRHQERAFGRPGATHANAVIR